VLAEQTELLYLTSICRRGNQSPETVTKICDAIREELEKKDAKMYINTILTAHVVKSPPDYEAGLAHLLSLKGASAAGPRSMFLPLKGFAENDQSLVEEAVKYIIFLVDAERLFDIALGMYDFSLVLLVAQHAQKVGSAHKDFTQFLIYFGFRIPESTCLSSRNFVPLRLTTSASALTII